MSLWTDLRDSANPLTNQGDPAWALLTGSLGMSTALGSPNTSALLGFPVGLLDAGSLAGNFRDDWRQFKHWVIPDPRRDREVMTTGPQTARRLIYGRVKVAGQVVYAETSGAGDATLHLIIVFAGHVCAAAEALYLDDVLITDPSFAGVVDYAVYLGDQVAADATMVALGTNWTTDHKLLGCTYARVSLTWADGLFPSGIPSITGIFQGRKLYDPRDASTAYTVNAALAVYDYMRLASSLGGMGCAASEVDLSLISTAADICDEQVVSDTIGGTEARYSINGVVDLAAPPQAILAQMLTAMDGQPMYVGGVWQIYAGAPGTLGEPVDVDWLRGDVGFSRGAGKSGLVNTVKMVLVDATANFGTVDPPVLQNADYLAEDGEELLATMNFPFTTSPTMARRLAKIAMEKSRAGKTVTLPCTLRALDLTPNDLVPLTLPRLKFEAKPMRVLEMGLSLTGGIDLTLGEERPGLYDWSVADLVATSTPGTVVVGQIPGGTATSDLSTGVAIDSGGIDLSGTSGIRSGNYVAGTSGWQLQGTGSSEFTSPTVNAKALTGEVAQMSDITWANVAGKPSTFAPSAHATSHQPGGADAMAVDAAAATGSLRTLGTGAQQAAAGDHAHATPPAHATSHQPGGADAMAVDAAAATGSLRTLGTGSQQAAAGDHAHGSLTLTDPATSGAPTHAAAKLTLWSDTDGIVYINTDGSTTWSKVGSQ